MPSYSKQAKQIESLSHSIVLHVILVTTYPKDKRSSAWWEKLSNFRSIIKRSINQKGGLLSRPEILADSMLRIVRRQREEATFSNYIDELKLDPSSIDWNKIELKINDLCENLER